ncbi:MAG: alkaline phosphatase family protein, partial [Eudoraea sp.]|nr:alkaline phosphatase family protein [Eudoraea sp.]
MKKLLFLLMLASFSFGSLLQKSSAQSSTNESYGANPKLVVGIVVDQMRYDYLSRFWGHYGEGGFKRLVNGGFTCKNNHFNYAPTSTGPGHASIYSGTTPSTHGIIGNTWYDKQSGKVVYCASDEQYNSIGTDMDTGKMSPHRMTVSTITDELRLFTQKKGKVIALALKDRGAVLPGGHMANAAYWFNGGMEGHWITSSYYMEELPKWVRNFNKTNPGEKYKTEWDTQKDISTYVESGTDDNMYEGLFGGELAPVFPHDLPKIWDDNSQFDILKGTPYGNSLTADFALAALDGEALGEDDITDFLAVSFSSTDYVGHQFGVNSKEIQDTYIRLDMELERLLKALDKKVGAGEYVVFLTSDHGAGDVTAYLKDQKIPAGNMDSQGMSAKFKEFMSFTYGDANLIKNFSNASFFLDHDVIRNLDLKVEEVQHAIGQELLSYDGISRVFTGHQMVQNEYTRGIPYIVQNGYNQKRSGDVMLVLDPAVVYYPETGSTHGSPYIYDTHVPLIFYGKGIPKGSTVE